MKKAGMIWYSGIFIGCSVFAFSLVFFSMTGRNIAAIPQNVIGIDFGARASTLDLSRCSRRSPILDLNQSTDPSLWVLAEYQEACSSFVVNSLVIETDLPGNVAEAAEAAGFMAKRLSEFSARGVSPLILVKPETNLVPTDIRPFVSGSGPAVLRAYFDAISDRGIRSEMMGTWIPFPEANLPHWNHRNATPEEFSSFSNLFLSALKARFPDAKGSLLLSSSTYESDVFDWGSGEYASLTPYVSGIKPGLVDSFAISGFPWSPPRRSGRLGVFDAREYLNIRLAMEAADALGVRSIRLFTGVFREKYTLDEEHTVELDASRRKDVINGILSEVETLRKKGYAPSLILLVENQSDRVEATDWSYWNDPRDVADPHRSVFIDMLSKAETMNIPISLSVGGGAGN